MAPETFFFGCVWGSQFRHAKHKLRCFMVDPVDPHGFFLTGTPPPMWLRPFHGTTDLRLRSYPRRNHVEPCCELLPTFELLFGGE